MSLCENHFSAATQKCYIKAEDLAAKCHTCMYNPVGRMEKVPVPTNPPLEEAVSVRDHNVGESDYSKHQIQPWDIWLEYEMNPWDADIVKRILRTKKSDSRKLDYEKIIHIAQERIRQLDMGLK